ncbi:bifunctional adenosylcobinamide kinase/adenosylcobinamide-phosphate guanylyltransferase [Flavobacterium sp. 7A]|uniref:bifunctional adenosylcobinamide kinase/adenosylcobinamide-phosphate guanylyltransferase n=1 Tax=Flavobacterium sp. 7A TaxID=2940571 RepID=UPI0022280867|nr:bifunctional adenosylcobinamide kinase/adenosylcobinamide-phosphate guanylyltransferase [Flavobacterium sp. 7A]MCW2119682.1 adenosylcobinamide kinase/adenosylcobinamide-phosphate guanylyltransferase [Flavobacterium sp. 7A]
MKKATIHFVSGGQRSGKSEYAESVALSLSEAPNYLATSKIWDDAFEKRITVHKNRRSDAWHTIEEEINIGSVIFQGNVVLMDCITLWITNIFDAYQYDVAKTIAHAQEEWDLLCEKDITVIVVTNEIGMGVIPMESSIRNFVDIQGKINQYVAQQADYATFMVSGLPLRVK